MAEQPAVPEDVTPQQFFEQLLPMGFQAQAAGGGAAPGDFAINFNLTGDGGGTWHAAIKDGAMTVTPGTQDANLSVTLSVDDWRDAVLNRNGAALSIILPANRPGKPDNSARAKGLKGTMALELARDASDPFKVEMQFNSAATPRTVLRMAIADYAGMQDGSQNGQMLFMQGKIKVEGDMGFLMQVASLNM
ncbi:MAG: SCP2 sterol-binding domain-containing protein [Deltaproteobacteria bacterium]|nr:SCP2 sterol-binding domain-containing protein [Deltaproteobacteria bacterium]